MATIVKRLWLVVGSLALGMWLTCPTLGQQTGPPKTGPGTGPPKTGPGNPTGLGVKDLPGLLMNSGIKYQVAGKGFQTNYRDVVLNLMERGKDDFRYAHIYWTISLPAGFKTSQAFFEKLNDLNNQDIFANITLVRNKDNAWISGDYAFLLRQGDAKVLAFFLNNASTTFNMSQKVLRPFMENN